MELLIVGIFLALVIGIMCMGKETIYYQHSLHSSDDLYRERTCDLCKVKFYIDWEVINDTYCSKFCEMRNQNLIGIILNLIYIVLYIGICIALGLALMIGGLWLIDQLQGLSKIESLLYLIIFLLLCQKQCNKKC